MLVGGDSLELCEHQCKTGTTISRDKCSKRVDGVQSVTVSYKTGTADVTFDPSKTSPDAIAKGITTKSGFKAEVVKK